jgi:hypothetical protein
MYFFIFKLQKKTKIIQMQIINSKAINRMEYKMLKFSIKKYIKIDNHNFVSKIS